METYVPISHDRCQLWIIYQAFVVEFFLVMVNALLIIRGASISSTSSSFLVLTDGKQVSAIWRYNRLIVMALSGLVLVEVGFMIRSAFVIAPDTTMNELCLFRETPQAAALFGYCF